MSTQNTRNEKTPDQRPLTKIQVERLSSLTGVAASKLNGLSVSEISQQFRWQIDPNLLLFRRICGKVVKKDPNTGIEYGVPFATVYAEDTICNILGLFPIDLPWSWFFPFFCHTEVIAQTTTDACGNFCVWVPRFEIEWILRWRIERICYLESFQKPTVGSVLKYLQGQPVGPGPGPDPGPEATVTLKTGTALYEKAKAVLGTEVVSRLAQLGSVKTFGAQTTGQQALLSRQAFSASVAPALPREFQKPVHGTASEHRAAVQSTLANKLALNASVLKDVDLTRFYGPFLRCFDIIVPEWVPILEVPDITFRVTQNINGVQQTIYSTGLFDVSWDANGDSNVTLVASPIAVSSTVCNTPDVPCGDVPSLEYVGLMPLVNPPLPAAPYIDAATGFATRPNPPHPGGTISEAGVPPAAAPYTDTLQIYGCTNVDNAAFYRLEYTYTPTRWFAHRARPVRRIDVAALSGGGRRFADHVAGVRFARMVPGYPDHRRLVPQFHGFGMEHGRRNMGGRPLHGTARGCRFGQDPAGHVLQGRVHGRQLISDRRIRRGVEFRVRHERRATFADHRLRRHRPRRDAHGRLRPGHLLGERKSPARNLG